VVTVGLSLCLGGEVIRKLAIVTAGSNFNHVVQMEKREDHELVTSGVYSLCRHPSYLGWFAWSFGTQVERTVSFIRLLSRSMHLE
jgi:protein-S-isoprenylcysteine O-methyltransferase